jgi:hypothetical protein
MKRLLAYATATTGIATVLLTAAPAQAGGVTNPAQHPAPVTVTIDGQTYHDGLDTLPGYDDNACTAIPNVQYDFDANKIYYYDDDGNLLASAPWTEWSRISSYQTWQKQHQHSSTPPPPSKPSKPVSKPTSKAPTSSRTTATAASHHTAGSGSQSRSSHPAGGAAPSGSATSGGHGVAGSTGAAASSAGSTATSSASGSGSAAAVVAGGTSSSGAAAPAANAPASGAASTAVAAPVNAQKLAKVVRASIGHGAGNTRFAGVAILLTFLAAGLALLLATTVRRRAFGPRPGRGAHS